MTLGGNTDITRGLFLGLFLVGVSVLGAAGLFLLAEPGAGDKVDLSLLGVTELSLSESSLSLSRPDLASAEVSDRFE